MASKLNNIGIIAIGSYCGEHLQTNAELAEQVHNYRVDRSGVDLDTWIQEHFGITTRAITHLLPSEMAFQAAAKALSAADMTATDIDFLILNTATGDYKQPTTANRVQTRLGMRSDSFAFEVNMPCAGVIYGLSLAKSMIQSSMGKTGLVIGVDKMSSLVDPEDFIMSGMFGDGAGACIVGANPVYSLTHSYLASCADEDGSLVIEAGGSALPIEPSHIASGKHYLKMQGSQTSDFIGKAIRESVENLLEQSESKRSDIDMVIPHQASKRIVARALTDLGFESSQMWFTIEKYGNTSAASLLITLEDYLSNHQDPASDILMVGMGGGLNWGGIQLKRTNS